MRKFKLIKKYEGSPQLGTEVNKCNDFPNYNFNGGNYTTAITAYFVENSPEFWQEVKEFPKIVSFRAKYIGPNVPRHFKHIRESALECYRYVYFTEDKKYRYQDDPYYTDFEIYQVAVSETEVFLLGEKIYAPGTSYKGVLNEFKVIRGNEFKIGIGIGDYANIYIDMCSIKKYKEPILVTDDNVEIFEGDEYFRVWNIDGKLIIDSYKCFATKEYKHGAFGGRVPHFSTKKAAEQFISENKPIYSKKQVREALELLKPVVEISMGRVIPGVDLSEFNNHLGL